MLNSMLINGDVAVCAQALGLARADDVQRIRLGLQLSGIGQYGDQ